MKILFLLSALSGAIAVNAQMSRNPSSSEILLKLRKLNFLGSVLYVAAHPDDENTRLIAYLSNERLANTAYLSLTRGDGGQNLIGEEIREGLGVIRTQELLAARRIDGGRQFFSRANDFGYSKSASETQKIWDSDQVMADVVWAYRNFRPDVVITRFPPDERAGHGHHTTSAIFAEEAFSKAADKNYFPGQLQYTDVWQPKRLYINTGRWWNPDINKNTPGITYVDVGGYNPLLGISYTEMAARSRSQHKSQGFGSTGTRGERYEYLEHRLGKKDDGDLFDGINTRWSRVEGGEKIEAMILKIIDNYNPADPAGIVPALLAVSNEIARLGDSHWKRIKLAETAVIIKSALGLYLEAVADDYSAAPGETIAIKIEAVNRSAVPAILEMVTYDHLSDTVMTHRLLNNVPLTYATSVTIPDNWEYSNPYWLKEKGTPGMYRTDNLLLRGTPENRPAIEVRFSIDIAGTKMVFAEPVIYKWNNPVEGELYRPFVIVPPAFANISEAVYLFNGDEAKAIKVTVKSMVPALEGYLRLDLPEGWHSDPQAVDLAVSGKGAEQVAVFQVSPPKETMSGQVAAVIAYAGKNYSRSLQTITYDHFPAQVLMPEARAKIVKTDISKKGNIVAYIKGAGDAVPAALREVGYEVREMEEGDVTPQNLEEADAVILGVRALNTNERSPFYIPVLLDYVSAGGTLIVQYNTSFRLKTEAFAPYPLRLSRGRVAEENAEVRILAPNHAVLNAPNRITPADFDGWVQERGLYFPDEWSDEYTAILSANDTGEPPKDGGLLIANYGQGHYIYTGYSWFRQLPAGVPGAFKLFVNMVSLGKGNDEKPAAPNAQKK